MIIKSNNTAPTPITIERATEQLRQERETFNQAKSHEMWWFRLRITMGFSSILLLVIVIVTSTYILLNHAEFPMNVVSFAGAALFADVLGMLLGVWKIVLNPKSASKLEPITNVAMNNIAQQEQYRI